MVVGKELGLGLPDAQIVVLKALLRYSKSLMLLRHKTWDSFMINLPSQDGFLENRLTCLTPQIHHKL